MVDTHYRAFISYSHRDREAAERLHRKLESYRVPSKLVGKLTKEGSVPRRLTPIFRDREDLPTSGSLSASVETALKRSRFLIVLCSPSAAASEWVDKEVALFKSLNGEDRLLGVIVDTEEAQAETDSEKLFPAALRYHVGPDGEITDQPVEPLAADLRESGDGEKYGVLKVVAGLIGVGLDDLVQRDQNRRNTRMKAITGAAVAAMLVMSGLTKIAFDASREATLQRTEAEGLVEFMLTDLKDKLETVGRLDALDSTGERALAYYAMQNANKLDADSLSRRARAQHLLGEIDQARNDLDAALAAYEAAAETTAELLSREPNNPDRIFNHAQSVFYVGYIAHQRGDAVTAEAHMSEYLQLANQLVAIDGANPKWRMELAFANGNLGAIEIAEKNWESAIAYFEQSAAAWNVMRTAEPDDDTFATEYAYTLSWMAIAKMQQGKFAEAKRLISEQLGVYDPILARRPEDINLIDPIAIAKRRHAESNLALGQTDEAVSDLAEAKAISDALLERDEDNAFWKLDAARVEILRSKLSGVSGDANVSRKAALRAAELADVAAGRDMSDTTTRTTLAQALAQLVRAYGDAPEASEAATRLQRLFDDAYAADEPDPGMIGDAGLALAEYYELMENTDRSRKTATAAYRTLQAQNDRLSATDLFTFYQLCLATQAGSSCESVANQLKEQSFQHPHFVALQGR